MKPSDLRPNPDPTRLTLERLRHDIGGLRELIETRLEAQKAISAERYASIQTRFIERDTRYETTVKDQRASIDAALHAAREVVNEQNRSSAVAISKAEIATNKQIDQLSVMISSMGSAFNDKLDDVKQRMTRIESEQTGKTLANTNHSTANSNSIALGAMVFGAILAIVAVITMVMQAKGMH